MILLKFETEIKGTSAIKGYEDNIVFESLAFNASKTVQGHGTTRKIDHAHISDVMLTKLGDVTSPEFMIQALTGISLGKATITVTGPEGTSNSPAVVLKIELCNAVVSSFSTQCGVNGVPTEHVSLAYDHIKYLYNGHNSANNSNKSDKSYNLITKKAEAPSKS